MRSLAHQELSDSLTQLSTSFRDIDHGHSRPAEPPADWDRHDCGKSAPDKEVKMVLGNRVHALLNRRARPALSATISEE